MTADNPQSMDIYSDEYIDQANAELAGRTCLNPDCYTRESGEVGTGRVEKKYNLTLEGLAGHNAFPARLDLIYTCSACQMKARLHK